MRTFLRMLYPFLIYMLLEYSYSNTYKYTSNRQKSKDIIGTTVLLVEQNARMALSIADRAYVLESGQIVISGTGKELSESDEIKKAYLGG